MQSPGKKGKSNTSREGDADNHELTCWNCKREIEDVGMNCPFCSVFIDKAKLDQISSSQLHAGAGGAILAGAVVADRYEISQEIGRGGMGVVYKANDRYMDREVALKVIPRELSMDPKAVADLKRETSLALELTHENIVRLYNLDTWNNHTFVTMEYVPGGTLSHLMVERGGSLTLEEALPLLRQTADALDYTHSKNPPVVHLDLKPLNLLITQDGSAKIADYGLARVLRDLATRISAWEAAGTLAYMAPEQIRGKGIGPWTDLYAFAAVAYELLSGQPPFYTGDLRWQIMHEEVDPIEDVPDYVNQALLMGLAKDASVRPATARHIVEMLAGERPVFEEEQYAETPDSAVEQSKPVTESTKKRGWVAYVGFAFTAALLLIVMAGLGWRYYGDQLKALVAGVEKPADEPISNRVNISPKIVDTDVTVAQSIPAGELSISSKPSGAEVYVEDVKKGITPFVFSKIPNGSYMLMLKKKGYQSWKKEVEVSSHKKTDIRAELKLESGGIEFSSNPVGGQVYLDGKFAGDTPLVMAQVDAGPHQVEIKKNGYQTWEKKMALKPGEVLKLSAVLVGLKGGVQLTSTPTGADVYVAGKRKGITPLRMRDVTAGKLRVELKKDCFGTAEKEIQVAAGKVSNVRVALKSECGGIQVNSQPAGAKFFVDGQYVGVTPGEKLSLKKGKHLVKLVKESLPQYAMNVNIRPGKTEKIYVELAEALPANLYRDPATGMEFVLVKQGCYQMGSPDDEVGRNTDEGPVHEVCVDDFWIAKHEVTQGQWKRVMQDNPSFFIKGDRYPAENISWNDVQRYISRLNEISGGNATYRLPTEAEWEYACRSGGKKELFSGDNKVDLVGWYKGNSKKMVHQVGTKSANGLGLFDMSGNVYEWVADSYSPDAYKIHERKNPLYNVKSDYKVCRGGSWLLPARDCRSTNRSYYFSNSRNYNLGFRLVKNP